jgi:hypothetical protein
MSRKPLPLSVEYVRGMVGGIGVKKLGKLDKFAATVAVLDEGMNLGQGCMMAAMDETMSL